MSRVYAAFYRGRAECFFSLSRLSSCLTRLVTRGSTPFVYLLFNNCMVIGNGKVENRTLGTATTATSESAAYERGFIRRYDQSHPLFYCDPP